DDRPDAAFEQTAQSHGQIHRCLTKDLDLRGWVGVAQSRRVSAPGRQQEPRNVQTVKKLAFGQLARRRDQDEEGMRRATGGLPPGGKLGWNSRIDGLGTKRAGPDEQRISVCPKL